MTHATLGTADDLSVAEKLLLRHAMTNTTADCRQLRGRDMIVRSDVLAAVVRGQVLPTHDDRLTGALADKSKPVARAVRLRGARVRGPLNLGGLAMQVPLELSFCNFTHKLVLTKVTAPNVDLRGSQLPGLSARYLSVTHTLNLGEGFESNGRTVLFGADVGELEAGHATLRNPEGTALSGDYLHVRGYANLENAVVFGSLDFLGLQVDGQLDMTGLRVTAPHHGDAINLDSGCIKGSFMLRGANLRGPAWMVGLRVDGQVAAERLVVSPQDATEHRPLPTCPTRSVPLLSGDGQEVDRDSEQTQVSVLVDVSSSQVVGTLDLTSATIEGRVKVAGASLGALDCTGMSIQPALASDPEASFVGLDLDSSTVVGAFHAHFAGPLDDLDLTNVSIGVYRDASACLPTTLHLIGAEYGALESDDISLDNRLEWVRLDRRYHPQKYTQLAASYRRLGDRQAVNRVLMAGQRERFRSIRGWRRVPVGLWSLALRLLVGYGYQPARAAVWVLGLLVLGALTAARLHSSGQIRATADTSTPFEPWRFVTDLLLPVAGLSDSADYKLSNAAAWFTYSFSLAGWFLAAIIVGAFTGLFRRE